MSGHRGAGIARTPALHAIRGRLAGGGPRSALTRALLASLAVALMLAAIPAAASAQAEDPDSYLYHWLINSPNTELPKSNGPFDATTTGTGEQPDLFDPPESGGLGENIGCQAQGTVWYGATEWWRFHPHRNGVVAVSVQGSGFTPVIAFMRVLPNQNPNYSFAESFRCFTGDSATNNVTAVYPLAVAAGATYAIQVGGTRTPNNQTGTPGSGDYTLALGYDPDTDGDGFLDSADRCPDQGGRDVDKHQGCPDSDGDGLIDREDACAGESGDVSRHRGCPDGDGDGIPEGSGGSDRCPGLGGRDAAKHGGCPDNDGDNIAEGPGASPRDACPTVNPDSVDRNDRKPRDGCPDTLKIATTALTTGHFYAGGIVVESFALKGVPNGARVRMVCKLPRGGRCGQATVRNARASSAKTLARAARTVGLKKKLRKRLPFGTRITASIRARYAASRFIRVTVNRKAGFLKHCGPSPRKLKRCK
jgi:hypothetical protein